MTWRALRGSFVLAALALTSSAARAAEPGSGVATADRLARADLFHDEYRQDLAEALVEVLRSLDQSKSGPDRALALIAEARVRRLRGEYVTARARLDEAEAQAPSDPSIRVRSLAERRWVDVDRFRMPWNESDTSTSDVECMAPGHRALVQEQWAKVTETILSDPGRMRELSRVGQGLQGWVGAAESGALARFVVGSTRSSPPLGFDSPQGQDREVIRQRDIFLKSIDLSIDIGARLHQIPPERVGQLRARLKAPLLALGGDGWRALQDKAACSDAASTRKPDDPRLEGQYALTCAEMRLFPGGAPETLGRVIVRPARNETTFAAASAFWAGEQKATEASAERAREAIDLLDRAGSAFERNHHRRGVARVAYVRAAEAFARALVAGAPSWPEDAARRAVVLAGESGDLVLSHQSQLLVSLTRALARDRAAARREIEPVLEAIKTQGDYGLGLGAARFAASLGAHQAFVRNEPASAEILNEVALDLYRAAGANEEATFLHLRWARILSASGAVAQAAAVLRSSLSLPVVCADGSPRPLALVRHLDVLKELLRHDLELNEPKAIELDLAALERAVGALAGGHIDPSEMLPKLKALLDEDAQLTRELSDMVTRNIVHDPGRKESLEALSRRQRRVFSEKLAIMAASSAGSMLTDFRCAFERLRGRAEIVDNPDKPLAEQYVSAERAARKMRGRLGSLVRMLLVAKRGDREQARRLWMLEVEEQAKRDMIVGNQLPVEVAARSRIAHFIEDVDVLNRIGAYDLARKRLGAIEKVAGKSWFRTMQEPWTHLQTYVDVARGTGDHVTSRALAREMLDSVEQRREGMFDEKFRLSVLDSTSASSVYAAAVEAAASASDALDALEFMERGKARGFRDRLVFEPVPQVRRARELAQGLLLLQELVPPAGRGAPPSPLTSRIEQEVERRRREYEPLLKEGPLSSAIISQAGEHDQIAERVSKQLGTSTLLLSYFFTDRSLVVVALAHGRDPIVHHVEVAGAVLEGRVRRLGSVLMRRLDPSHAEHDATELSRLLFGSPPVEALLKSSAFKELVIVPHGVLHEVPFAYLPFQTKPLVARFVLRIVPYAGMLLVPPRAGAPPTEPAAVMAFAGDDPDVALSRAASEANRVASFYRVTPRLDPPRSALLSAMQTAGVVHLVAHGLSPTSGRGFARIDLPKVSEEDDGDMLTSDILFHDAPLSASAVVLSSCELGAGRRTPGDEGLGISRALLQRGVGTVIAPIWRLADALPVMSMMLDFHRIYANGANSAPDALALAQRRAIEQGIEPAYWAAFLAIGGSR